MPTTKAHKTRHHSNLRPKHKNTKNYVQAYWPYLPLMMLLLIATVLIQPWHILVTNGKVLPYATNLSTQQLLQETNAQRSQSDKTELTLNSKLSQAAQAKANDMAEKNYWSHNTPDGDAPWVFIDETGYEYQKAGENLAYGFLNSQQVVAGWMNSQTHRDNLLDASYQDVGFGFADNPDYDNNGPSTVVVAMYGTRINPAAVPIQANDQSYNSLATIASEPAPKSISKVQALTNGTWPWASYLIGFVVGACVMFLVAKHTRMLKKALLEGESFVLHHPLLDATLVALIVVGILITRQIGVIL